LQFHIPDDLDIIALHTVAAKNEALVNGQQGYCLLHALEFLFRAPEFLFHVPDFNSHALLQMSA